MTVIFDADLVDLNVAVVVPASTVSVIATIPMKTGPTPLLAGEILRISAEVMGVDANGGGIYAEQMFGPVLGGSSPAIMAWDLTPTSVLAETDTTNGLSGVGLVVNGSGDLEIRWSNVSSEDQSLSFRIKQRLVETA